MQRMAGLVLVLLTGCSTAPCADLMDAWSPGRVEPGPVYGGVCTGPGCQPSVPSPTSFATSQGEPEPGVVPVNYTAKPAPAAGTVPAPAMAPATGSWKRMASSNDASSQRSPATGP